MRPRSAVRTPVRGVFPLVAVAPFFASESLGGRCLAVVGGSGEVGSFFTTIWGTALRELLHRVSYPSQCQCLPQIKTYDSSSVGFLGEVVRLVGAESTSIGVVVVSVVIEGAITMSMNQ